VGDAALADVIRSGLRPGKIIVPGAWQTQGYGKPGGTIPAGLALASNSPADYLRHNLTARCLYVRRFEVPASWKARRVFLAVRRVYSYADVALNGTPIGKWEGFCSPFEFEVTDRIQFGKGNQLEIGIDNRPRPGRESYGTANWFANWGGIGGNVCLEARGPQFVRNVFAMPRIKASEVQLRIELAIGATAPRGMTIAADVAPWEASGRSAVVGEAQSPLSTMTKDGRIDLHVPIKDARLWTPDNPYLYLARVRLVRECQVVDEHAARFGMREITAEGNRLFLNGTPLYLSGYGDDATEPISGMLPADKEVYRQRLRTMRALGFNFVRHHSAVPHDEYLDAADEVGILVQPKAGMIYTKYWPTGHRLFENEWPQIVRAFRNHPCIWAWCMGNELFLSDLPEKDLAPGAADVVKPAAKRPFYASEDSATASRTAAFTRDQALSLVAKAYRQAKELDPTRLVHASDGGQLQPSSDVYSPCGGQQGGPKPFLFHEYGNYCCSLPDFTLIPRLNGVIRPLTYERAERFVTAHGLAGDYPRLYRNSLLMRAEAQKSCIETAKARDGNCGFSLWLGIDFPESPEGCWDEGILNQLWEPKPYLTEGLSDILGSTVLLCNTGLDSRSFYGDQPKKVGLSLWHYGHQPISSAKLVWRIADGDRTLQSGERGPIACESGKRLSIGEVQIRVSAAPSPRFLDLQVELQQQGRRIAKNTWPFYAYPRPDVVQPIPGVYSEAGPVPGSRELKPGLPLPDDLRLLIARKLTRGRHGPLLRRGRATILLLGTGGFAENRRGFFLNSFGGAFGGVVEKHPIFDSIPHGGRIHPGLYQLIAGGGLLEAERMPAALRNGSVVWGLKLDDWLAVMKNLHRVTLLSDVRANNDLQLILCDLDLLSDKPESRYVLDKAINYLVAQKARSVARRCAEADLEVLLESP